MRDRLRSARLTAAAVFALLLFNYPFLAVFDRGILVLGVPVLWVYLFIVWAFVIALGAWISRS
ncbi:MAG TPA: hypothetical protein VFD59_06480 [Nocardioidaceae bacterium]|nr:hypothetical protein [Nocardioidaceae bacterium]